jgi:predicted patatin/cPLA2 family phospholipase
MQTLGLPVPNARFQPGQCPFLCEDVGVRYTRNLCRSFPDDIAWWEGKNVFNSSWFAEVTMAPDYEFDFYIKGVDA